MADIPATNRNQAGALQGIFACGFGLLPARSGRRRNFCPRCYTHFASGFLDRLGG